MENCPPGFVLRSTDDGSRGLTCQCDYGDGNIFACNVEKQSVDLKVTKDVNFILFTFFPIGWLICSRPF